MLYYTFLNQNHSEGGWTWHESERVLRDLLLFVSYQVENREIPHFLIPGINLAKNTLKFGKNGISLEEVGRHLRRLVTSGEYLPAEDLGKDFS